MRIQPRLLLTTQNLGVIARYSNDLQGQVLFQIKDMKVVQNYPIETKPPHERVACMRHTLVHLMDCMLRSVFSADDILHALCRSPTPQVVHAEANALLNKNQAHVTGAVSATTG